MNYLNFDNLLSQIGTITFFLAMLLAVFHYRVAWLLLVVAQILFIYPSIYDSIMNEDASMVFIRLLLATDPAIFIIICIYGFFRWGSYKQQIQQNFNTTLDAPLTPHTQLSTISLHSISSKEVLYSIPVFIFAPLPFYIIAWYLGLEIQGSTWSVTLFFSCQALVFFWLAQKIYQTWFLFLAILALNVLPIGIIIDFKVKILLAALGIFCAVRWHREFSLQKKASTTA